MTTEEHEYSVELIDDMIVIDNNGSYHYEIELSRIPDERGLLEWVYHLSEKGWVTRALLRTVIKIAADHKGFKLFSGI